jgi:biopolymer transport protein ExbD
MAKQTITVYIDQNNQYFVGESRVNVDELERRLAAGIGGQQEATVVLRSDKTVAVQYVVNVIDAVNKINQKTGQKHKVILATSAKQ